MHAVRGLVALGKGEPVNVETETASRLGTAFAGRLDHALRLDAPSLIGVPVDYSPDSRHHGRLEEETTPT